ncbi:FliH/SctL family protein [Sporomusa malonica]|uniref:Flagellar assembly protein FliH n=1 Tax=Sporomusa malonica TaxID=112901 RepID=A0A1W2AZ48_9FIRM|nr:FliH/SctL family protein [Sporomusa malonica]SMC65989.1 flagellar assembly protein FliH [Sporomusa malonica]
MSKILKSVLFEKSSPIIIKHRPAVEPVREEPQQPVVPEIFLDTVRNEAESILALAQTSAAQCLADAELHAQELAQQAQELARQAQEEGLSQGYEEGFTQGRQAALSEMQQTLQLSVERAHRIVTIAEQEACQLVFDAERQIVEIALAVASKVLAREIAENPTTILPIVKEALGKVSDQDHIVIRVNPEDYEMVLMAKRDLQLMVGREHAVSVSADHIVPAGGCIIDTALGTVDAKLDTKLEMVHKAIQEILP